MSEMTKEEKALRIEESKIVQNLIHCEDWICKTSGEPELQQSWILKKEQFEAELEEFRLKNNLYER